MDGCACNGTGGVLVEHVYIYTHIYVVQRSKQASVFMFSNTNRYIIVNTYIHRYILHWCIIMNGI